ncbi:hypothetical protein Tco_0414307 [Tanacetum coccineum]
MSNLKFAETHNSIAFLEKPKESDGFERIIDFLNASSIRYALTIQALVDKKKVIITETSIRIDLKLEDAEGTYCLPTATIFAELERMSAKTTAWNEFSSTMASAIICGVKFLMYPRFVQVFLDNLVEGMTKHKGIYVTPSHTKKVFANMKRPGKGFSGKVTPLFQTMMVQAPEDMGEDSAASTDSHFIPIITQPLVQKKTKEGQCLQEKVLDLEKAKTAQAKEIASLKKRVKQLEKRKKRMHPNRGIADLDADAEVTLIDETQERNDEEMLFDVQDDLQGEEVVAEKEVAKKEVSDDDPVTTAGEVVTTANVEVTTANAPRTTIDELTLAQTLKEIKAAKPKAVTTATTTTITTTIRPKARGVAKDKGKAIMVEPEKPLKRKDQIALDQEVTRNLEVQLQAELEEEERLARQKEEEATIAFIESWDNTQAMIEADRLLAERLQIREQEELTDKEKARLFVDLLEKRKKHFAALRAK